MPALCDEFIDLVWRISWQAGAIAILVFLLQRTLGRAISARWRHAFWMLVMVRLLLPVLPNSRFSLFCFIASTPQSTTAVEHAVPDGVSTVTVWMIGKSQAKPSTSDLVAITAKSQSPVQRSELLIAAWFLIAATLFVLRVIRNAQFCSRLNNAGKDCSPRLAQLLDRACEQCKVLRKPKLILTELVTAPAVAGAFRSTILLPTHLPNQLSDDDLHLVLLHELAHIKCFDVAIDWLWAFVQSLHWFNPILWIVTPLRHNDRELARDEMVLSVTGQPQASKYGQLLIDLSQFSRLPLFCPGLIGMLAGKKCLQRRVKMIARFDGNHWYATVAGVVLMIIAGCCTLTTPPPTTAKSPALSTTAPDASVSGPHDDFRNLSNATMTEGDRAAQQKLDEGLPELRFNARPLEEVIGTLRHATGASIEGDWAALERAKISRRAPVTARFHDTKLSKALDLIFNSVEGNADNEKLAYSIDDGIINISTRQELEDRTVTRRYDINDLLFVPQDYSNQPDLRLQNASQIQTGDSTIAADPHGKDWAARVEEIKKYIIERVEPETWKDNGGHTGSISSSPLRAVLLITQTDRAQRKVQAVLNDLRQSRSNQISIESRFITLSEATESTLPEGLRSRLVSVCNAGRYRRDQFLTDAEVTQLIRASLSGKSSSQLTTPRLTLFSGQTAQLSVATQQAYVADLVEVRLPGAALFDPVVKTVDATSLKIKVTSCDSPDEATAFVDLHYQLDQLLQLIKERYSNGSITGTIQRPVSLHCTLSTACGVPNKLTLLLGLAPTVDAVDSKFRAGSSERNASDAEVEKLRADQELKHEYVLIKPVILKRS